MDQKITSLAKDIKRNACTEVPAADCKEEDKELSRASISRT